MSTTTKNMQMLKEVRTALFDNDPTRSAQASPTNLKTPKEARKEVETLRDQLSDLHEFRTQQRFLGKRDRVLSCAWRHGIVGVDDADSDATQVFYQSAKNDKMSVTNGKD